MGKLIARYLGISLSR